MFRTFWANPLDELRYQGAVIDIAAVVFVGFWEIWINEAVYVERVLQDTVMVKRFIALILF